MIEVRVSRESINDEFVIVQRVLLLDGAIAQPEQVVVEIETSKTVLEVTAPVGGIVRHSLSLGSEMPVGALLFSVGEGEVVGPAAVEAEAMAAPREVGELPTVRAVVGAPVLSRAAELASARVSADLSEFAGRWVTEAEILSGRVNAAAALEPSPEYPATAATLPSESRARPTMPHDEIVKSMRKRAEVDSLLKGQHAATTSTIGIRIVLPGDRLVAPGILFKDSIADLLIFEAARLLRKYPELNGFNIDARTAGRYHSVNFGLSFDDERNLKVLSLSDADLLGLPEIQRRYLELLDLYESKRPIPNELLNEVTVTLSDLSGTAASFMLPLINGQQAMILGVVRHQRRLFEVFASFDHRVAEGLTVTKFLENLRERIVSHFRGSDGIARLNCDGCGRSMHDEVRLGGRGFVNVTLRGGDSGQLCRNCFEER